MRGDDMLQRPLLLINCKNYGDTGELAEEVARASVRVLERRGASGKRRVTIALAVPATSLYRAAGLGLVPVLVEHLDPELPGATTGHIIAEDVMRNGGVGALLNHSEDRYEEEELRRAVARAREAGLVSVVCAKDDEAAALYASFQPDF
ncbi:triose-phosphate isomerase, partial [Candidatus Woesearchaeota archaeon]|nr:triose-phosphate isomerase [Candidatus Woesearchaeota archaeon]